MAKRRGNQAGSVTQLPDGRWQARASYWEGGSAQAQGGLWEDPCRSRAEAA